MTKKELIGKLKRGQKSFSIFDVATLLNLHPDKVLQQLYKVGGGIRQHFGNAYIPVEDILKIIPDLEQYYQPKKKELSKRDKSIEKYYKTLLLLP